MTDSTPRRLVALMIAFALSGCSQQLGAPSVVLAPDGDAPDHSEPFVDGTVPSGFAEAVAAETVPLEILLAIGKAETSFQMVTGEAEFEGQEVAYGLMGLRESNLQLAAELSGQDPELVKTNRTANVLAVAALLAEWAYEAGIDQTDLAAWAPIVARYSGIEDADAAAEYVYYEIYEEMETGVSLEGFEMKSEAVTPNYPAPLRHGNRTGDSSAIWSPSPNHSSRGSYDPEFVIIHTCEGSYSGCWSWLRNSSAGVSAHYVVNNTGSEVRHLVDEDRKAWHISADYSCSRNSNTDCNRNGVGMNSISVGIEHAGYGSQSSWDSGLIERSAELTCGITQRHGIPRDQYHIVGHGQLQPWNRSDPGAAWPWSSYLQQVNEACGTGTSTGGGGTSGGTGGTGGTSGGNTGGTGGTGGGSTGGGTSTPGGSQIVIDSNNNANNPATHYVDVSSDWWASANVSGYYNTGYWVAATGAISDPANFRFQGAGCYTVEAWWTQGSDRPTNATFIGFNSDEVEVGRQSVNQRINGGQWNTLGNWEFGTGWNNVALSRWTAAGTYVVADAVRLTPSSQCN